MASETDAVPHSRGPAAAAVAAHLRRSGAAAEAPWLHVEVARRMVDRLQWIKAQPAVVIDWWGASGGGRALLQAQYPQARIEAVEPTPALADRSERDVRLPWWSHKRWARAATPVSPEAAAPADGRAHLVWSNMMLHWSSEPSAIFARWRAALAVDGFVMFSCFGPDTLKELRSLYRHRVWGPAAHDFIDMHDLGDALVHAGFADPVMDMETITLTWPDAAKAVAELRGLGGNAAAGRHPGLRTPRWHAGLLAQTQDALAAPDGRLGLSFEIIYGHAFQPAPRLAVGKETRVSADELQAMARRRPSRLTDPG